ncbi:MAG: AmmeMemoRadiSam system protein A [Syntrophomonadaceae bacterium]|jgi:AmmeMemoRadiSam system protein A|nr:AmmeMemoRadiSam system protein A [Syntrophomonadaceae bacterium]
MLTYAALSPHPPLIIPYIGGARLRDVESTVTAMKAMAGQLAQSHPETVVFFTPHGNVFADCITALVEPRLYGDFSHFGSRHQGPTYRNDLELLSEIGRLCSDADISMLAIDEGLARKYKLQENLDHGILVPLHYIREAGCHDIAIIALSIAYLPLLELYQTGLLIRHAAERLGRRVAIVASGDMSHHLKSDGPYSYHPDGPRFDQAMRDMLARGDVAGILEMDEGMRRNAGECGYRSVVMMLGALDGISFEPEVFSYEGPFGVGYLVAGFKPGTEAKPSILEQEQERQSQAIQQKRQQESMPVRWARMVLEEYIRNHKLPALPAEMAELKQKSAGVFVSLKKKGQLRGCIGTITATRPDLAQEIAANAVSAATKDYRFPPLKAEELPELVYSVDILGEPEPASRDQLNPKEYGVIVSSGGKRGLLLPDLEGVDTVEQQLQIALQKAGISHNEAYTIERFKVTRYT